MALTTEGGSRGRREWTLSAPAFERLLTTFASDREQAAELYERARIKLVRLFEWRGCAEAAELADETFDRVARRLEEGAELTVSDPYAYVHGVALRVLQEYWRRPGRATLAFDREAGRATPSAPELLGGDEDDEREARLRCLERCLASLPAEQRRRLERYHGADPGTRIRNRQALAAELGLSENALRIQTYRRRAQLRSCIALCVAQHRRPAKRMAPLRIEGRGEERE